MQQPIVISGAGILGCYISCALSLQGIDSIVLEKKDDEVEDSVRTITLNPFSKNLLDKIGHQLKLSDTIGSTQSIQIIDGINYGFADPRRPNAGVSVE